MFEHLRPGDVVTVTRDASHPAWKNLSAEKLAETWPCTVVSVSVVSLQDVRVARLTSGLEYDLATGEQYHCGATKIIDPTKEG